LSVAAMGVAVPVARLVSPRVASRQSISFLTWFPGPANPYSRSGFTPHAAEAAIQTSPPRAEREAEHEVERELRLFQNEFRAKMHRIKHEKRSDLSESEVRKYRGEYLRRRTTILQRHCVNGRDYPLHARLWDYVGLPAPKRSRYKI
jgi:hypothetical protein